MGQRQVGRGPTSQINETVLLLGKHDASDQSLLHPASKANHSKEIVSCRKLSNEQSVSEQLKGYSNINYKRFITSENDPIKTRAPLQLTVAMNKQSMRQGVISQRYK